MNTKRKSANGEKIMSKLQTIEDTLFISNEEYHAQKEFLSASTIKTLLKNPYEFLHPIQKNSSAFSVGSAVHSLILEPHKFETEFSVAPQADKRTKEGKETWYKFETQNKGKTLLSDAEHTLSKSMSEAVLSTPEIKILLQNGVAESSYFSEIEDVKVKCRPDYYREDLGIVIDVKTVQDASPDAFIKDVANYGYYIQASFYMDVLASLSKPANKFLFLVVEKKEPFMCGLYELDLVSLDFGRAEYKRAFEIFRDIDNFKMPIYKDTNDKSVVQTLTLPNYVYYKRGA
jgi:exodeoxyribonuclease VIII